MEKWKGEIINSLQGIEKAQPPENTFLKIQERIDAKKTTGGKQWIAVAASITLVLFANILFITNYTNDQSVIENQSDDYPSIISNFNPYE